MSDNNSSQAPAGWLLPLANTTIIPASLLLSASGIMLNIVALWSEDIRESMGYGFLTCAMAPGALILLLSAATLAASNVSTTASDTDKKVDKKADLALAATLSIFFIVIFGITNLLLHQETAVSKIPAVAVFPTVLSGAWAVALALVAFSAFYKGCEQLSAKCNMNTDTNSPSRTYSFWNKAKQAMVELMPVPLKSQ